MRRPMMLVAISTLLFSIIVSAGDDTQSFSISKTTKYKNEKARIAVNTRNGDVLVVWLQTHRGPDDLEQVYTARCKAGKAKYRVKRPRLVSTPGVVCTETTVEYSSADNTYVVAWSAWQLSPPFGRNLPNIRTRMLNAVGKPVDAINEVATAVNPEMTPVLTMLPAGSSAPAPNGSVYLLVYDYSPRDSSALGPGDPEAGLYGLYLNNKGEKTISNPFLIMLAPLKGTIHAGRTWVTDILLCQDGTFLLGASKVTTTAFRAAHLIKLNRNAKHVDDTLLGENESFSVGAIQLGPDLFMSWWDHTRGSKDKSHLGLVDGSLGMLAEFSPLDGEDAWPIKLVKLEDDPGGYLICSDGRYLFGRYISPDGAPGERARKLFKHRGKLNHLDAACVPGSNRIFVAWTKKMGGDAEIRGFIFTADIP